MKKSFSAMSTAIIFTVLLIISLVSSLFAFTSDSIRFASGELETANLTIHDFSLKDFEVIGDNSLLTTSPDPQLVINNYNKTSTMLRIKFISNKYPGEVNLFYTRGEEEYSNSQKIWGKAKNDGTYEFVMPRGVLSGIRLDPANFTNVELSFISIELNPKRSFTSYFKHSGEEILLFFVIGIVLSCLSKCIYEAFYNEISLISTKFVFKKRKTNG